MIRYLLYRFIPYYFVLLLLIGGFLLLSSETGLQLIWQQASKRLPENVNIQKVSGNLLGRIYVKGLRVHSESLDLSVREAWLQWKPSALFQAQLQIDDFMMLGTRLETHAKTAAGPDESQPRSEALPNWPDILIKNLQVREFEWLDDEVSKLQISRVRLNASLQDQKLDLHLREFDSRESGPLAAELDSQILPQAIKIQRFKLQTLGPSETTISLSGNCDWPSLDCLAAVQWQNLQWPLQNEARFQSQAGRAQLEHSAHQKSLRLEASLFGQQLPDSDLIVTANWQPTQEFWQLAAAWSQNNANQSKLNVTAEFAPQSTRFDATVTPENIDLASWLPDWPSALGGRLQVQGTLQPQWHVQAKSVQLAGSIREQAIDLKAHGAMSSEEWSVDQLQLDWANNSLKAHLKHGSTWNGALNLSANDLAALDPALAGSVSAQASIKGRQALPHVQWQAQIKQLKWQDLNLSQLQSEGVFAPQQLQADFRLNGLEAGPLSVEQLRVQSQGTPASAQTQLEFTESRGGGRAVIRSQWSEQTQKFTASLSDAQWQSLMGSQSYLWKLQEGASFHWHKSGWKLSQQCWQSIETALCAQLQMQDSKIQGEVQLRDYPLPRLKSQLPVGSRMDGVANLRLKITDSSVRAPDVSLDLSTSPTTIIRTLGDDEFELLRFDQGSLKAQLQQQAITASWSFPVSKAAASETQNSGLWGSAQLNAEKDLDLALNLAFDDIGVIAAFSAEILQAEGGLSGHLQLTGPVQEPQLDADIVLGPASVSLDQPNLKLEDLRLKLSSQADQKIRLAGEFRSGDGQLALDGLIENWRTQPSFSAQLTGEDVLVMNTSEARVVVSPNLKLESRLPELKLRGDVLVSQAQIRPRDLDQSGAIAPVEDQLIVGDTAAVERKLQIDSELKLVLGSDVSVEAMGLNSEIQGKLSTRLKPGKVTTAVGKLSLVNGRYKAYGQDLRIERGELIFSGGPVSEPGLDLKAYRQARADVRAGVIVRGPIRAPRVSLYSDPDMRETDQLSYLVLGRAAEAQNDDDQAALNNAALALGLKGSDLLAKQFKSQLGLDEVSIGTQAGQSADQASLVLGKYLSPDIYVSYGVGLFEPIYTFKLRYQLSRQWTLQTESGVESSGDLYYTIER